MGDESKSVELRLGLFPPFSMGQNDFLEAFLK